MNFSLNEIQMMLADSIDKFIANEYDFDTRQGFAASAGGFSNDVWKTFAELGWTSVPFSEEDGGIDGGAVEMTVVMERFGRGLIVEPYLACVVLAGGILKRTASPKQKQAMLQPLIAGELQATLAFAEPQSRYEIQNIATRASKEEGQWVLNGAKCYVLNAETADVIIIPARTSGNQTDTSGITLFAVPADAQGLTALHYPTVDGLRGSQLTLADVRISDNQRLGEIDDGYEAIRLATDEATLAVSAEAVGIMSILTEKTIEFAKNRVQFGVPISSFQALQHRMVDMYTHCEQTRSLMLWAAMSVDSTDAERALHAFKYQVSEAGKKVAEEAVQIHGGMGVTWELDVAHYFKRLITIGHILGNADWHLGKLAELS